MPDAFGRSRRRFSLLSRFRGTQPAEGRDKLGPWFWLVLGAFGYIAYASLGHFGQSVTWVLDWNRAHDIRRTGDEAGRLFEKMVNWRHSGHGGTRETGLIFYDGDTGELRANVDCLAERTGLSGQVRTSDRGVATSDLEETQIRQRFCLTDVGHAIREEVDLWNNTSRVLAVRDNFYREPTCADGAPIGLFVREACFPNRWQAALFDGTPPYRKLETFPGEGPSADLFGFIARKSAIGKGDWRRINLASVEQRWTILAYDNLIDATGNISRQVDVVGEVACFIVDGTITKVAPVDIVPEICTGRLGGRVNTAAGPRGVDVLCALPGQTTERCLQRLEGNRLDPKAPILAHAYRFTLPRNARVQSLRVVARSVPALPRLLADMTAIELTPVAENDATRRENDRRIALTRHIRLACKSPDDDDERLADAGVQIGAPAESVFLDLDLTGRPSGQQAPSQTYQCQLGWQMATDTQAPQRVDIVSTVSATGVGKPAEGDPERRVEDLTRTVEVVDRPNQPASSAKRSSAVPTDKAIELGLLPLIGLDDTDTGSLLGQARLLGRPGQTPRITLTVDLDFQATAVGVLSNIMSDAPPYSWLKEGDVLRPAFKDDRRGFLILMDAGPIPATGVYKPDDRSGEVLAIATHPSVVKGMARWDLSALERFRPSESPLVARAWSQTDRFMAPGSTYKVLTALAAIDASLGNKPELRDLFKDKDKDVLSRPELEDLMGGKAKFDLGKSGLSVPRFDDSRRRPPFVINNYSPKIPNCGSIVSGCPATGYGVRNAMMRSSNVFFARLALAVDETTVSCVTANDGDREVSAANPSACNADTSGFVGTSRMQAMANRLWDVETIDLVPALKEQSRPAARPGGRLRPTAISSDLTNLTQPRRAALAFNGIGQMVQVPPLAMASIMASVATGHVVQPRLTDRGRPESEHQFLFSERSDAPQTEVTEKREVAEDLLAVLRQSLEMVVQSKDGTANRAFRDDENLRKRVWGKTGTAQIGGAERPPNTVWFAGWIKGLGNGRYKDRMIAFACAITHVDIEAGTGGSVCAPAMRELFQTIEATPNDPTQSSRAAR